MVHQYKLNGYNIVLDTCSGSVHTVDEVAYDIIAMYKTNSEEEIVKAILEKYSHLPDVTRESRPFIAEVHTLLASSNSVYKSEFDAEAYIVAAEFVHVSKVL